MSKKLRESDAPYGKISKIRDFMASGNGFVILNESVHVAEGEVIYRKRSRRKESSAL